MKSSFMTFACPDWPLKKIIQAAVEHRYHGIEFRCDARQRHGVEAFITKEDRKSIRGSLEKAELEACCLATGLQMINHTAVADAQQRIELAADIGCRALRVLCGPKPQDMSMDEVIHRVAEHLHQAAERADELGISLLLETHDTFSRGADAAAAVRLAEHRAVGILYDNLHPFRMGETLEESMAALNGLILHTHFHDGLNRPDKVVIKALDEGELPMDDMFQALIKIGYDGYISGEWFNEGTYGPDPNEALDRFQKDLRTLSERNGVVIRA